MLRCTSTQRAPRPRSALRWGWLGPSATDLSMVLDMQQRDDHQLRLPLASRSRGCSQHLALLLFPLGATSNEKSPEILVDSRFSGLLLWRYRWDLNPRWSCPHTCFRDMILRPLGHGTESECRPCAQPGPKATEEGLPRSSTGGTGGPQGTLPGWAGLLRCRAA